MPIVASISTYLPCWGTPRHRVPGDDEDLGFVERFGTHELLMADITPLDGALSVNHTGGLKSKERPPGATCVAQCVELFAYLRGEAVKQVDVARIGLAHNVGGPTVVAAVSLLEGTLHGAR